MNEKERTLLQRTLALILKPVLRLLIKNEVSYAEFAEMAKQAYVDVSYKHFSITGRKTTFSRVAVLTGLSRKEVVRLTKNQSTNQPVAATPNRAQRVVNGWLGDPEFIDENANAKVLPIQGESGSFSALVARYSGDITLGAVIDELLRIGVVRRVEKTHVELASTGYIPKTDELEKMRVMALCTSDLLNSAVHNLLNSEEPARYQRQLAYQKLSTESAQQFKRYSEAKANELLLHLNEYLSQLHSVTDVCDGESHRVGMGIYYLESEDHIEAQNDAQGEIQNEIQNEI